MKISSMLLLLLCCFSASSNAADYGYIDPGDYYYINGWGDDNEKVMVVRKMGGNKVKVRNVYSGSSKVVDASRLLTRGELQAEEITNTVGGVAVGAALIYCLVNPDDCK